MPETDGPTVTEQDGFLHITWPDHLSMSTDPLPLFYSVQGEVIADFVGKINDLRGTVIRLQKEIHTYLEKAIAQERDLISSQHTILGLQERATVYERDITKLQECKKPTKTPEPKSINEKMKILIEYIAESIAIGRSKQDREYLAPGIAYRAAEEMGLFNE